MRHLNCLVCMVYMHMQTVVPCSLPSVHKRCLLYCSTFKQLTGGDGDADLLFTMDKHVIFNEGIVMSVR